VIDINKIIALTWQAAWVVANIVLFKDAQEDNEGSEWWEDYGDWWNELDRQIDAGNVEVEERKRNNRWGRPRN
jgi:hypothetical protein